jgi:WD40 repeat protein
MPTATRTFRVFISSTFEDLKAERDALQREVFPKLRKLCEANNARFQAIDLRWGVRDEAALDQQTIEICLREIERCQQTGIKPNFIVLLGERYGWCPLPARIEAEEFTRVRDRAAETDMRLIDDWYVRDDNAVPPEFLLKLRTGEFTDKDRWGGVEQRLHRILREAAREAGLTPESLIRYEASATHQEILKGLGKSAEDRKHVFAFLRESAEGTAEGPELAALKQELRNKLPADNIHPFSANEINKLCADVESKLCAVILAETGRFTSRPALDLEIEAHEKFALDRANHFTGRTSILKGIGKHIRKHKPHPLVVHGLSGCGKSAIMAKAAALAKQAAPDAVQIQRFIGVTPDSSSGVSLLSSLCQQLSREYGITEEAPIGFQPLVAAFHERIARATAEKPLVIFLDALDQLREDDEARSFTWLHQNQPPHVSLIVSTTEIPAGLTSAAHVAVKEFPARHAKKVLMAWLADAKRTLRWRQRRKVLKGFAKSRLPLYLKLAFEEARRWRSFDDVENCELCSDVGSMIDMLFNRLSAEANHGPILVNRGLGYLAAAHFGLTEDEMLDVLTADDAVWSDFDKRKHHEVSERRLPVVVWSRLSLDLEPYLTERAAPGGNVISFFHRQLTERVEATLLVGGETQARHHDLAGYFSTKPAWLDEGHKTPNARRAAELVFQQRGAQQWSEAEATLFDCPFLFAKVAAGLVVDLDGDYRTLLQDAPESGLTRREDLRLVQGTLRLSLHVLANDPNQFASQMRGRLLPHQDKTGISTFLRDIDACTSRPQLRPLWPTLEAAGGPMLRILEGHTRSVKAVALSADGKRAISGSSDDTLRIWDLAGNQPPRILEGHTGNVNAVALSADGKRAVSGSDDSTLRVWDLEGIQPPCILEGDTTMVSAVAISGDGKRVIAGSTGYTVQVWDLEHSRRPRILKGKGHTRPVVAVAISGDGNRAISSSADKTVQVWDLEHNRPLQLLQGLTHEVAAVALSRDGKRAVLGSWDTTLLIWDLVGNQPPRVLRGHTCGIRAVAISADGKRAASSSGTVVRGCGDNTIRVWDLEGNQSVSILKGHAGSVCAVALSADGKCVVSGSDDYTVRVWDLEDSQHPRLTEGHTSAVNAVALSADGKRAVSGSDDYSVCVWDLDGNRPPRVLKDHSGPVSDVALSRDGQRVVCAGSTTLNVWDLDGNQAPRVLEGRTEEGRRWFFTAVALSADGRRAVSGSKEESTLRIWDLEGNQPPRLLDVDGDVNSVHPRVLSDKHWRTSSSSKPDSTIRVMDWEDDEVPFFLYGHHGTVKTVALSADGKCAISGAEGDCTIWVWELEDEQPPCLLIGHDHSVNAVALSADGKRAVSGSGDETLRVWDLEGNESPQTLIGHKGRVNAVALSADGKRAVSSSNDKTVRVWDLKSGTCMAVFTCDAWVLSCAWAGQRIVAGDKGGRVHLFAWEE